MEIPVGDHGHNARETCGVLASSHHLTVYEKNLDSRGTSPGVCESLEEPVIPPAPLTGDVGRDRGDAGRALLFCSSPCNANVAPRAPAPSPRSRARTA